MTTGRVNRKRFKWTDKLDALLGTAFDADVSNRIGASVKQIRYRRKCLDIPSYVPPSIVSARAAITPELLAKLEHHTADELAAQIGVSSSRINIARRAAGLPSKNRGELPSQALIEQLGSRYAKEIAAEFNVSEDYVNRWRRKLGIAAFKPDSSIEPELFALLGKDSDENLAERFGLTTHKVGALRRKRNIPACPRPRQFTFQETRDILSDLSLSNTEVAARLNISAANISTTRRRHGLEPRASRRTARLVWNAEHLALLGKLPDREVAQRMQISHTSVYIKRTELGIEGFRTSQSSPLDKCLADYLGRTRSWLIAQKFDMSLQAVLDAHSEAGVSLHPLDQWMSKDLIRRLRTERIADLAQETGVSKAALNVLRRKLGFPSTRRPASD